MNDETRGRWIAVILFVCIGPLLVCLASLIVDALFKDNFITLATTTLGFVITGLLIFRVMPKEELL